METIQVPGDTHSSMTTLAEWLGKVSCTLPNKCKEQETHVSLLGGSYGRLLIPDKMHVSWITNYTTELQRGAHSLFFVERKTPIFRMHFDLDFNQSTAVPLDYLERMGRDANMIFRQFFPELGEDAPEWKIAVLTVPPKPVEKDGVCSVKSGCHMIWPSLHVDQGIALQLRLNFLAYINRTWPPRPEGANAYDDVVDESVLKGNGLRMYGSDKASKCKKCRGRRVHCDAKCWNGVIVENRAYTLATVITPSGTDEVTLAELKSDLHKCVTRTSTRVSNKTPTPGFKVPSHAITNAGVKTARVAARKRAAGGGKSGWEMIDRACPIFDQLQGYIRSQLNSRLKWVGLDLKNIYLVRQRGVYICHVEGPGSLYCEHVGRAHSSSTIYFEVDQRGISQRCFSHKKTNGVACSVYRGDPVPMNNWLRDAMFGSSTFVPYVDNATPTDVETTEVTNDPFSAFPNPDFPGMTYGEVTRITDTLYKRTLKRKCLSTLRDPKVVHAEIVKETPIVIPKAKRKR